MCSSIREFGFKVPVLARSDGEVVDGQLHRLEEVLRAGAGEQREAVRGGPQLCRQVLLDPINVSYETGACRRLRRKRPGSGVELLPYEGCKVVPAMVVGLGVQIKADDGQRSGSESCQSIDLFGKQIGHDVKTALRIEHETDQVPPGGT